MSSYLRSIPNKFTSFVTTRWQITNIDHQLTKHVKSSPFLDEFLGIHTGTNWTSNPKQKVINSMVPFLNENATYTSSDSRNEKQKALNKKCNRTKNQLVKLHEQRQINIGIIDIINPNPISISILKNNASSGRSHVNFKSKHSNLLFTDADSSKRVETNILLNSERERNLYAEISPNVQNLNEKQPSEDRKPSETQLQNVFNILGEDLPLLFIKQINYAIYTADIVFVNNIKGTTTVGVHHYIKQIALLKLVGHLKYAYIKLNILKMTMHPEDSSIKVRWRIIGLSGTRIFLTFWKFRVWNIKEQVDDKTTWYDGFSTFYVNNDGKVFKHVVDKMMPDQDVEEKVKTPIETKLALFSALLSSDSHYFTKFCLKKHSQLFRIK